MKKLVLIDGNAIIHRAYHALPKTMTTRSGEPTNAVYGFATAMIKVLEDLKPEYLAASFDLAGPTFRHEAFADYKATRVKADQELYDQIPRVKEMLLAMNIPIYEMQGFEADDVIGTITSKIQDTRNKLQTNSKRDSSPVAQNDKPDKLTPNSYSLEVYIVSGDKDIFQLIDGNVKVYNLRRGLSDTQIVDREVIEKEYHLQPEDFIDLKALAGDASDNIPGVPGIGPKTATQLLQDFDTLEKLYEAIETKELKNGRTKEQIKPRILELLIKHRDQAFLSQKLATIHKNVPIEFDIEKARFGNYDRMKLREFFEQLGFKSLLRRFGVTEAKEDQISTAEQAKKDKQLKLL